MENALRHRHGVRVAVTASGVSVVLPWMMQQAAAKMQSFRTPETLPRSVAQDKQSQTTSHISPKELFKRSLRQINVSERSSPEVICESKLVYAPPTSQDRIAGLAWQIKTKTPKEAARCLMKLCLEIKIQGSNCHRLIVRHGLVPFILKALKSDIFHERLSASEALFSLTLDEEACVAIRASNGFERLIDRIVEGPRGGRVTTNSTAALSNICYFKRHAEAMRFLNIFKPLLCLARDESATSKQVEYACAALSNMAAIEENQRPLCKAGAIGILNDIETEAEHSMAAYHAHNAIQNISSNLSRNMCRSLLSHSTVTVDLITMEPEHLKLNSFQSQSPDEGGDFELVVPADSRMPMAPATDSTPMYVGASNTRSDALEEEQERWNEEWKEITARCASLHIKRS